MLIQTSVAGHEGLDALRISPAALFVKVMARMLRRAHALAEQVGDAARDDAGFAAAGPGEDEQRPLEMSDGFLLGGREVGEKVGGLPAVLGHCEILLRRSN